MDITYIARTTKKSTKARGVHVAARHAMQALEVLDPEVPIYAHGDFRDNEVYTVSPDEDERRAWREKLYAAKEEQGELTL